MEREIATLCIDKAWVDEKDKSLIGYNLVDPDDVDHVLVTPRSSKLGKLLLKEIKVVEKENQLDAAQEVEDAAAADRDDPRPRNVRKEEIAFKAATGGLDHGEFASHPYGSAGDDSGEVSVAPTVTRTVRLDGRGGFGFPVNPW